MRESKGNQYAFDSYAGVSTSQGIPQISGYMCSGCMCSGKQAFNLSTPKSVESSNLKSVPGSSLEKSVAKVPVFQNRKVISPRSGMLDQN